MVAVQTSVEVVEAVKVIEVVVAVVQVMAAAISGKGRNQFLGCKCSYPAHIPVYIQGGLGPLTKGALTEPRDMREPVRAIRVLGKDSIENNFRAIQSSYQSLDTRNPNTLTPKH